MRHIARYFLLLTLVGMMSTIVGQEGDAASDASNRNNHSQQSQMKGVGTIEDRVVRFTGIVQSPDGPHQIDGEIVLPPTPAPLITGAQLAEAVREARQAGRLEFSLILTLAAVAGVALLALLDYVVKKRFGEPPE